jgi:ornithine cyclodeaminase/alanine dehydrogenase-like protein (mu-crystallin family)
MAARTLRFLSAEDVRKSLPMAEAVEIMKRAFAYLSAGQAVVPPRIHLDVCDGRGVALFMPSYLPAAERIGLKMITLCGDNPARGLPRIQALMCVLDATTGTPLAMMDGTVLTAIRTGAASGAATDLLARAESCTAAIFGAGVQGRTQLEAVCAVRPVRKAWVFDVSRELAESFAQDMGPALHIDVQTAGSAAEALRDADIVCTATTSKTPVFSDGEIRPGVHLNAVGSYQPDVQEIPVETVLRALLVVDHRASALEEPGDLLIPLAQGLFREDHIHAELGELVAGSKPGRTSPETVTMFKSVGVAVQDLAAAVHVLRRAAQLALGTEVPW